MVGAGADGGQVEAAFEPTPTSARSARRFVTATLEGWSLSPLVELATLLVSELMANVVLHAGTAAVVRLHRLPGRVRVEVGDGSLRPPVLKRYSGTATTGRGLNLVETLSADWGVDTAPGGKVVWFELEEAARGLQAAGEALLGAALEAHPRDGGGQPPGGLRSTHSSPSVSDAQHGGRAQRRWPSTVGSGR